MAYIPSTYARGPELRAPLRHQAALVFDLRQLQATGATSAQLRSACAPNPTWVPPAEAQHYLVLPFDLLDQAQRAALPHLVVPRAAQLLGSRPDQLALQVPPSFAEKSMVFLKDPMQLYYSPF